ncbi:Sio3 (plasmid) [Streptantibioticus cattleyicolor NRRL 8057 = DSM 46488]|uniref:Sio3 n=1 Tax=Streptantibioticus cattleyicolor (strain ATCC 35852 / DSM 46488 / JCM 4925 / NBRC 14057 / NRRL 8057) TaxID=1003195 RepID=F8JKU7_STREN
MIGYAVTPSQGFAALLRYWLALGPVTGLLYGPMAGLAFALTALLEAPADTESAVSPAELLAANGRTALFEVVVFSLVIGGVSGIPYAAGWIRGVDWLLIGAVGGLGGGLSYGLGLTAWGQWVALCRVWLPLTGRLPWTVGAFLRDAHQRGVLRQAGAVHQFRHARLQHRLAGGDLGRGTEVGR